MILGNMQCGNKATLPPMLLVEVHSMTSTKLNCSNVSSTQKGGRAHNPFQKTHYPPPLDWTRNTKRFCDDVGVCGVCFLFMTKRSTIIGTFESVA
jgi:hypothetical protein